MEMPKQPTQEQIAALMSHPSEGPVVMVNVLRFAKGEGEGEYQKYGEKVAVILEKIGAKPHYMGTFDSTVIGDFDETFDAIALVQYPSRKAFLDMAMSEEYQAIHPHRDKGLESQWLLASTPFPIAGP
jgi:uncharacterized protein (DUF1330 family)